MNNGTYDWGEFLTVRTDATLGVRTGFATAVDDTAVTLTVEDPDGVTASRETTVPT